MVLLKLVVGPREKVYSRILWDREVNAFSVFFLMRQKGRLHIHLNN